MCSNTNRMAQPGGSNRLLSPFEAIAASNKVEKRIVTLIQKIMPLNSQGTDKCTGNNAALNTHSANPTRVAEKRPRLNFKCSKNSRHVTTEFFDSLRHQSARRWLIPAATVLELFTVTSGISDHPPAARRFSASPARGSTVAAVRAVCHRRRVWAAPSCPARRPAPFATPQPGAGG